MKYLELTFADPAGNLACDEALLEMFEAERIDDGLLRIWRPENYFVVLGHSNSLVSEANLPVCAAEAIPILRRVSGGGTVLQGPGCLNYSLILNCQHHGLRNIATTFRYVLERHRQMISALAGREVCVEGISDLTLARRKFSGNAQYRKSHYALVHGTFLLSLDLSLLDRCLRLPAKQPDYRENRSHIEFVTNLHLDAGRLQRGLREEWQAEIGFADVPLDHVRLLMQNRYGLEQWSRKF